MYQAVVAQVIGLARDAALCAAPRQCGKVLHLVQCHASFLRGLCQRARDGVLRTAGQAGRPAAHRGGIGLAEYFKIGLLRLATGDGAGFVQRQPTQLAPFF